MLKRLHCGELLCGKRFFAGNLTITPLGIPLISYVGEFFAVLEVLMDFAGDKKILSTTIFSVAFG